MFTKKNYLRYLSHLDLMRLFQRCFNRSQIPIKYSEGFNPHPKFSIAHPLSLGIESEGEFMEIDLAEEISIEDFIDKMNYSLPKDIQIVKAKYVDGDESVTKLISYAFYEIKLLISKETEIENIENITREWLKNDEILITRYRKKGKNKILVDENIKPLIGNVVVKGFDDHNFLVINALFKVGEKGNLKPMDFIGAMNRDLKLDIDMDLVYIKRLNLFAEENGKLYSPM
ncbi:TIGR03936 family radical SAM-associated protein [Paratissierella segnis]|jgi:radical SAM-linked protein|nr:TIGR03936 family radical SAM-associated protein [Paratissierella segnis]